MALSRLDLELILTRAARSVSVRTRRLEGDVRSVRTSEIQTAIDLSVPTLGAARASCAAIALRHPLQNCGRRGERLSARTGDNMMISWSVGWLSHQMFASAGLRLLVMNFQNWIEYALGTL